MVLLLGALRLLGGVGDGLDVVFIKKTLKSERGRWVTGWGQSVIKERKEKFGAIWSRRKSLLEPGCVQCLLPNQFSNCGGAYSLCFNI